MKRLIIMMTLLFTAVIALSQQKNPDKIIYKNGTEESVYIKYKIDNELYYSSYSDYRDYWFVKLSKLNIVIIKDSARRCAIFPELCTNDTVNVNKYLYKISNIESMKLDTTSTYNDIKIQMSLNKFRKLQLTGYALMIGGTIISSIATSIDSNNDAKIGIGIIAGAVSITGLVIMIDSYKWLNYKKLKLVNSPYGLTIRLDF